MIYIYRWQHVFLQPKRPLKLIVSCFPSEAPSEFKFLYDARKDSIKEKILKVVQEVYGGAEVRYSEQAEAVLKRYQADEAIRCLPICMSKTQYSLSDAVFRWVSRAFSRFRPRFRGFSIDFLRFSRR